MSETIIFFGNERLASGVDEDGRLLKSLIDAGHKISHLVLNQAEIQGRNKRPAAVLAIAKQNHIPIINEWDKQAVLNAIQSDGARLGVLAAYGKIIPEAVIDAFEFGILNIHPSLLPKNRGSTPIESVILDGSTQTGVSLMALVKKMDAGPVYGHVKLDIDPSWSKQQLFEQLLDAGSALLLELLPGIVEREIIGLEQDEDEATFCSILSKDDGKIDWSKSAQDLQREVRAYLGWPGSRAEIAGREVIITDVSVMNEDGEAGKAEKVEKQLVVFCGQGSLRINKLKPAGKNEMTGQAFLAGNPL